MSIFDQAIDTLLALRLEDWHGLPDGTTADVQRRLGAPASSLNTHLGMQPALAEDYPSPATAAGGLLVFSRAGRVVAVQTRHPPPPPVLAALDPPDVRWPGEFLLAGYLVREFIYCRRGLALSVAEALAADPSESAKIVRCRGMAPLASAQEFDGRYYLAQHSRLVFDPGIADR